MNHRLLAALFADAEAYEMVPMAASASRGEAERESFETALPRAAARG